MLVQASRHWELEAICSSLLFRTFSTMVSTNSWKGVSFSIFRPGADLEGASWHGYAALSDHTAGATVGTLIKLPARVSFPSSLPLHVHLHIPSCPLLFHHRCWWKGVRLSWWQQQQQAGKGQMVRDGRRHATEHGGKWRRLWDQGQDSYLTWRLKVHGCCSCSMASLSWLLGWRRRELRPSTP